MVFSCQRCGNCCRWRGYVRLSSQEITLIAKFLGMQEVDFIEKHTRLTTERTGLSLNENIDGSCIFLEESPCSCKIDQVKPRQCRDFPNKWNFPEWEKECTGAKDLR